MKVECKMKLKKTYKYIYHNITAEAKESLTKPNKSANASQENPLQAPSDLVM